jgi:hypothetical protein
MERSRRAPHRVVDPGPCSDLRRRGYRRMEDGLSDDANELPRGDRHVARALGYPHVLRRSGVLKEEDALQVQFIGRILVARRDMARCRLRLVRLVLQRLLALSGAARATGAPTPGSVLGAYAGNLMLRSQNAVSRGKA